jgi:ribosomal protein S18 acetylase RimI-like enzyme
MSAEEYERFISDHTEDFANDLVITDNQPLEKMKVRAAEKIGSLLVHGQSTQDHHFRKAVCPELGKSVGNFWLHIKTKEAEAYIYYVVVNPDERRKGYGRQIMELLENFAKERGCRQIWLNVMSNNPGAQKLYENSGFSVATIHMSKNL